MHEQMARQKNKPRSLKGYKARQSVSVLIDNVKEIQRVKDWAGYACISTDWLRKILRKTYNKPPKQILREVRFEIVTLLIKECGWEACGDGIAIDSGMGKNGKALHQFLKNHYGTTFTDLKEEILTGKRDVIYVWLNGISL